MISLPAPPKPSSREGIQGIGEHMQPQQSPQKKSLVSTIFSAPTLIGLVGIGCMTYGLANGINVMPLFFGICIVLGAVLLHFVRKKDWDAHWAEMDRIKQEHERRMAEVEAEDREKKG